ncbi:hypothetical protein G6553_14175 [Nocardioides sp. IC4_145]|nr:hypothetical protein [Nocardioides sp. IC4_145]
MAISSAVAEGDAFLSVRDVHELLGEAQRDVGLSTVYRALCALADRGVARRRARKRWSAQVPEACRRVGHPDRVPVLRRCGAGPGDPGRWLDQALVRARGIRGRPACAPDLRCVWCVQRSGLSGGG